MEKEKKKKKKVISELKITRREKKDQHAQNTHTNDTRREKGRVKI